MSEPDEISKLLRLKKYEQPGSDYFERFVGDFHRRQRSEMLRQPLWRIALDRATGFLHGQPKWDIYSYGAATAAAVVVFLGIANFDARNTGQQAGLNGQAGVSGQQVAAVDKTDARPAQPDTQAERPRYVIDTRPVSYHEPPFSF